ncbi:MAG TPA: hypothetical protein VHW24_22045 [Bryobacteraceae bacterium]|jgi:hypothetical protein|nr:hypothetical protein [Bryobacteraceae bacterium]
MKTKSLLIGAFALASVAFAGSKSYDISLSKAAKAGSVELPAGDYKLKVDGTTAVFTDSHHKSFTTAVKVEAATKKFSSTAVDSSETGAKDLIHAIMLGGSTTKIDFEQATPGN